MDKKYEAKGRIDFVATVDDVKVAQRDKEWYRNEFGSKDEDMFNFYWNDHFNKTIYDLMTGEEFLEEIRSGCITDYDGTVSTVFVDGHISNLGLYTYNGFECGEFKVDEELWLQICDNYKVEVNWANK